MSTFPRGSVIARACCSGLVWEMKAKLEKSLAPQQTQRLLMEQGMGLTLPSGCTFSPASCPDETALPNPRAHSACPFPLEWPTSWMEHPRTTLRTLRHSAEDLLLVSVGTVLQALGAVLRTALPGHGGACPCKHGRLVGVLEEGSPVWIIWDDF